MRSAMFRIVITTFIPFLFSACGVTYHNKVERLGSNHNVLLIDAKQRAIFSAQRPETQNATEKRLLVCAEPSPDAISALATSSGFNLSAQDKATLVATLALSSEAAMHTINTIDA